MGTELVSAASVVGRHVFYNNSAYDGKNASADAADDAAIAPDKAALLPGDAPSFANYTSYSRGINGVMVDIAGLPEGGTESITADDFEFRVGNTGDPASWTTAPTPLAVVVRPTGADGPARVSMVWADAAIRNQWLQVTVKANAHTGLAATDVFFFGNLVGEIGNAQRAYVSSQDLILTRRAMFSRAPIDGLHDFDRNGAVTFQDVLLVRRNQSKGLRATEAFAGAGMGLTATYFENQDFTGPTVQKIDPVIDFNWQSGAPAPGINPYSYSVRWEGQVRAAYSEKYTFHTTSNDGVRLWVDGELLIDNWTNHAVTEDVGQIALEAGRRYDLRMEYYQGVGTAAAKLEWSSPSLSRELVPTSRLFPALLPPPPPPPEDPLAVRPPPLDGEWEMVFGDEFDGPALNPVWRTAQYWDSDHTIVGGGELQAYDASGVSVSDGKLHLTARPEEKYAGVPYVSGLVQTGGDDDVPDGPKFSFLHGYMEVRAKLPAGTGLFPAIWMMPASYNDENGELDVMETIGSDISRANFTLHRNGLDDGHEWLGPDLSEDFHSFGVDWQPDHVAWYVDGVERARTTDPALICPEAMYPILNLAVGGDWAGPPGATTTFPASLEVEFVRVWQRVSAGV